MPGIGQIRPGPFDDCDIDDLFAEVRKMTDVKIETNSSGMIPSLKKQNQCIKDENGQLDGKDAMMESELDSISVGRDHSPKLKLTEPSSKKAVTASSPLYSDFPDATSAAKQSFETIHDCIYANKYIGSTEHEAMECDCAEEWDANTSTNVACDEDSDCINRATKMECVGDCGCGNDCQNQRFQRKSYASVSVIKTDKKGYGLRADVDLRADQFIFEYIGEVIGEAQFRKRMIMYDEQGIKHFYFMSLTQGEFVDATKRGNLGRFCNHSCNPNCYVDKWVVGEKLRMGIFAERNILAGEELVFNYNVDRYGADPQPCYCGEPNCTGFIGGKTQTERATQLSHATIEALGIEDGDGWDTAVARRPRKKKTGEDDEEYVNNVQARELDEDGVTKVVATLMQTKEKWIAVKLLRRIQQAYEEKVRNRVVKMHGYQILNSTLVQWKEDSNVVLQVFDILDKFPRLTRNKIADSKIETTLAALKIHDDDRVSTKADYLLEEWSQLEVAYRIPRKKRGVDSTANLDKSNRFSRRDDREPRRNRSRSKSRSKSRSPTPPEDSSRMALGQTGARGQYGNRRGDFHGVGRPSYRPKLPLGWASTIDDKGRTYYYDLSGKTTWERPTAPSGAAPPPKALANNKALEDIINEITNAKTVNIKEQQESESVQQTTAVDPRKEVKKSAPIEKWKRLPIEKQMKLYENTLFPHIKYVMDKFKHKLPKDDLKRFAKEISKKLVGSDYKNGRVEDPTTITSRKQKQVKIYVKEYFDKAVTKHRAREVKNGNTAQIKVSTARETTHTQPVGSGQETRPAPASEESDAEVELSDDEAECVEDNDRSGSLQLISQASPGDNLKRKRSQSCNNSGNGDVHSHEVYESSPKKSMRTESEMMEDEIDAVNLLVPPPPPPPLLSPDDVVMVGDVTPQGEITMYGTDPA